MNTTNAHDEAWEAGNQWVRDSDRWEKLDFLKETCSEEFMNNPSGLISEMIRWMDEDQFDAFFNNLRRHQYVQTPQELELSMNS